MTTRKPRNCAFCFLVLRAYITGSDSSPCLTSRLISSVPRTQSLLLSLSLPWSLCLLPPPSTAMKLFQSKHEFQYEWSLVSAANWQKYPNEHCPHVQHVDVLNRTLDPETGILTTERLITVDQNVPALIMKVSQSPKLYILSLCVSMRTRHHTQQQHKKKKKNPPELMVKLKKLDYGLSHDAIRTRDFRNRPQEEDVNHVE